MYLYAPHRFVSLASAFIVPRRSVRCQGPHIHLILHRHRPEASFSAAYDLLSVPQFATMRGSRKGGLFRAHHGIVKINIESRDIIIIAMLHPFRHYISDELRTKLGIGVVALRNVTMIDCRDRRQSWMT